MSGANEAFGNSQNLTFLDVDEPEIGADTQGNEYPYDLTLATQTQSQQTQSLAPFSQVDELASQAQRDGSRTTKLKTDSLNKSSNRADPLNGLGKKVEKLSLGELENQSGLPKHACAYCGVSNPACVVMCNSTGKWFCNGRGSTSAAHIVTVITFFT